MTILNCLLDLHLLVQEAVIKAFADKVPKVVIAAVDIVTTALRSVVIIRQNLCQANRQTNLHSVLIAVFVQPLWCEGCVPSAPSEITSKAF